MLNYIVPIQIEADDEIMPLMRMLAENALAKRITADTMVHMLNNMVDEDFWLVEWASIDGKSVASGIVSRRAAETMDDGLDAKGPFYDAVRANLFDTTSVDGDRFEVRLDLDVTALMFRGAL